MGRDLKHDELKALAAFSKDLDSDTRDYFFPREKSVEQGVNFPTKECPTNIVAAHHNKNEGVLTQLEGGASWIPNTWQEGPKDMS